MRYAILTLLMLAQSALAQQQVLLQGTGNMQYADGSDGRKKLYSGDSESHLVENHQKNKNTSRNLGATRHQMPSSENSAIYRCHDGANVVFVDEDNRRKFRSCSRVSGKKNAPTADTAYRPSEQQSALPMEIVVDGVVVASGSSTTETASPDTGAPPSQSTPPAQNPSPTQSASQEAPSTGAVFSGSPCSGALLYQGNTYLFSEHEPCPIPHSLFLNRKPLEAQPNYYAPPASPSSPETPTQ